MDQIGNLINLAFHLFMIFILFSSGIAIFALLRFGQSRIVSILTTLFYISLITSLYFQAITLINQI